MQQKLIVAAMAAFASGAVLAQSSVTIYGTVDMGFAHRSSNMAKGVKSQNAINSGQAEASMIGFKGVEDLGNGNKALFVLESSFAVDTGENEAPFFDEQAYLGMSGSWGTAIAGRLLAPRYDFLMALDPFADGTVGRFGNVYEADAAAANVDRVNNAVAYVSPSFSGFNVTAAYATNALGGENLGNSGDARTYTLLPRYSNGPLDVGLAWQLVSVKNSPTKYKQWTLGASYDFDAVKLSAAYDAYKETTASGSFDPKMKSWMLGLSAPFGKSAVQFSYNQSKYKEASGGSYGKAYQWALGYTYDLSKRTNFYAAVAHITNKKKNGSFIRHASLADEGNAGEGYRNGFQFGLKHDF